MTMRHLQMAVLALVLAAVVAGCGRKGSLELPPGATPPPAAAETSKGFDDEELPIDLRATDDGMGATRTTRGNED